MDAILIVSADAEFNKGIAAAATGFGIAVAVCNGLDALRGLEDVRFSAAVVDHELDRNAGLSFSRQIQRLVGRVPVVLIGEDDTAPPDDFRPEAMKAFLPKRSGHRRILDAAILAHHLSLAPEDESFEGRPPKRSR